MNLLVVGGAFDFSADFPELSVVARRLQGAKWLLRDDGSLWFLDANGALRVDAVLWRVGAIRPQNEHRLALELIRLAGVPGVNPAQTLLRGFERLSMLAELRAIGVPLVPFSVALGDGVLEAIEPDLPCVLKVGNWHGGIGKALCQMRESWEDARDLALAANDYATVEPFIPYRRDVRVMIIGEQMWAMERRSGAWKVNRGTAQTKLIPVPDEIGEWTKRVRAHLNADVLGLDWIESEEGRWTCLESNDVPGLSGWPDEVRRALVARVREGML
jgi:ribosomal protein S6--L-glutamate ligase